MKTVKYLPIVALCGMAMLTGCDENAWNDKLDGFDSSFTPTEVHSVDYTLTAEDYGTIASNSTNKALAEAAGVSKELAALSGTKAFTPVISASEYIPAFLASTSGQFYTFTDGSSIRVTYNETEELPEQVKNATNAYQVTVDTDFYINDVWESDENYIPAFAPEKLPARYLPSFLNGALPDAEAGQYAVVTYDLATTNPIFGNVGGDEPQGFELSDVIATIAPDDVVSIDGVVGGSCTCGFVLTDKSGTIFVYMGSGFDVNTYPVGTQLHLEGTATSFKNNLQIAMGATLEVKGTQEYTFPAPTVLDGAALDAVLSRPANVLAEYVRVSGTVAVSGNNINLVVAGAETAKGSIYYATDAQKAELTDGRNVTVTGWFVSISGSRYCNLVIDQLDFSASAPRKAPTSRSIAAPVPTNTYRAVYTFDGNTWTTPADFVICEAPNAATNAGKWLDINYPYASTDDVKYVLYLSGSNYLCKYFVFNGKEWVENNGVTVKTSQFVLSQGKWRFDPNVTINLAVGKGIPASSAFYQACVDWVYENKCVPLGDTSIKSGKFWVTSYGNNEYYGGTSAYQNNVDLRASSAQSQYAAGWEGYSKKEIVETMMARCDQEIFPAVLDQMYPDADVVPGFEVVYTINFYAYAENAAGKYTTYPCVSKFKLVSKGHFEYLSSDWCIGIQWPDWMN